MNIKHLTSLIILFCLNLVNSVEIRIITLAGNELGTVQLPETKQEALDQYFEQSDGVTVLNADGTRILSGHLRLNHMFIQKMLLPNEEQIATEDDELTVSILMKQIKCQVELGLDVNFKCRLGGIFTKTGEIRINNSLTHINPIIDQEICTWRNTDDRSEHSSAIAARSGLGVPNLLLAQFFGAPDTFEETFELDEDRYDISPCDYLEIVEQMGTSHYVSRLYNPEYSISNPMELVKLMKFLESRTEVVLPRIRADLEQENTSENDPNYYTTKLRKNQYFPRLTLRYEALEDLGITQALIDEAPDYIPVTAILSYSATWGLNLGFFCHKQNGRATLIFSKQLSWALFEDELYYDIEQFERYLNFLSNYLEAPIHVEFDPVKRIIPRSLHSWILDDGSDMIPDCGVLLNRMTFDNLCHMVVELNQKLTGEDEADMHINEKGVHIMFGPRFEDDARSNISENTSSEYSFDGFDCEDGESEVPESDSEVDCEANVCPYLTDDGF